MTTKVKICGINTPQAMLAAAQAGADWVGFVFARASPRHVTPRQAAALSALHPGGPLRVGLFIDPTDQDIEDALEELPLDTLQLYASAERAAEIHLSFGVATWRALPIASAADLPRHATLDGYVIEAPPPTGATRPGGNATSLDHALLHGWTPAFPWLLAGGLTPHNVAAAIRATQAPAVDVSSGVEDRPGTKSTEKIQEFIRQARQAVLF